MTTLTFKVSEADAERIRREARRRKEPVSAYIRSLLPREETRVRRVYKKNSVTGVIVDATPGPEITLAQVKAALADYP